MGCHSSLGGDVLGLRSRVHGRSFHKARISFVNGFCHGERGAGVAVVFVDRSFVCLITSFSPDYMQQCTLLTSAMYVNQKTLVLIKCHKTHLVELCASVINTKQRVIQIYRTQASPRKRQQGLESQHLGNH